MIRAILVTRNGRLAAADIRGHAGYAPHGQDIVCSAVSTAVHMTALGLTDVLGLDITAKADASGAAAILVKEPDLDRAQDLMKTLAAELGEIARQYPDCIRIINQEWREFKCFS